MKRCKPRPLPGTRHCYTEAVGRGALEPATYWCQANATTSVCTCEDARGCEFGSIDGWGGHPKDCHMEDCHMVRFAPSPIKAMISSVA